jgi:rhamnose transport system ATP-binding protein
LDELFQVADRVTVLRDGVAVATRPIADLDHADLIRLMVGRELAAVFPKQSLPIGECLLELRGLGCRDSGIQDVNLNVRAGEIVGLAGLVGAGRTELARILFGLTPADTGQILLRGKQVAIRSPAAAIAHGMAYVPEDRRRHGVILELPIRANTSLAILPRLSKAIRLDSDREHSLATTMIGRLGIKASSTESPAAELSGGNQQKVALARWLATEPALLILDEPTQGIDVGAKAEIHRLMGELAARGIGILMISSELPEVLGMSDRIFVMHGGAVAGELSRGEATQEKVLALALGHSRSVRRAG